MFYKKSTKIDEIFIVDLTFITKKLLDLFCSKYQIDGEDFVNFCGLLIKHGLY